MHITEEYLRSHPNDVFVFGDNLLRVGSGGAAKLRHLPNAYGFITKKEPNNNDDSFFRANLEYLEIFDREYRKLERMIKSNPHKRFLISKLGSGLANRYKIWENIIHNRLALLTLYSNVVLLWIEE